MFLLDDGRPVLSATDLTSHLACEHLSQQRRAIALGERARPRPQEDPHAELVKRRGLEHEREQLAQLGPYEDLSDAEPPFTIAALDASAARTAAAMRAGAPLIYQ